MAKAFLVGRNAHVGVALCCRGGSEGNAKGRHGGRNGGAQDDDEEEEAAVAAAVAAETVGEKLHCWKMRRR